MSEKERLDPDDFTARVLMHYRVLDRQFSNRDQFDQESPAGRPASSDSPTLRQRMLGYLGRKVNDMYFETPDVVELIDEADRVLGSTEIRRLICQNFNYEPQVSPHLQAIRELIRILSSAEIKGLIIPADPQLYAMLAQMLLDRGLDAYCGRETEERQPEPADGTDAESHNERGRKYHLSENYEDAIREFTFAIQLGPRLAELYYNRALSYLESGNYRAATDDVNQAIELDPGDASYFYVRATAEANRGHVLDAIADLGKAIELDSSDPDFYCARAILNRDFGRLEDALRDLSGAIELLPGYGEYYSMRAAIYRHLGKLDLAESDELTAKRYENDG